MRTVKEALAIVLSWALSVAFSTAYGLLLQEHQVESVGLWLRVVVVSALVGWFVTPAIWRLLLGR